MNTPPKKSPPPMKSAPPPMAMPTAARPPAKQPQDILASLKFQLTQPLAWLIAIASLMPLALLMGQALTDNLTANPVQAATLRTGKTALVLLVISLACTPLNTITGWKLPLKAKRATGIYGWLYVAVHFGIFIFDSGYIEGAIDLMSVYAATFEKRYAVVGFIAFVLLTALFITSTKGWQKRLGKKWKTLHKAVYVTVPIGVLHFALLVKSITGRPEPLIWGGLVLLLLLVRQTSVRQFILKIRNQWLSRYIQPSQTAR
jgi:sulfoxide reductase heme-binding subunit YedZ